MPTPEGAVKNWIKKEILSKYPMAYVYVTNIGQYGKRGVPDLVMCINGLFVTIEVKTVSGKLTPIQELEGKRIEKSGGIWCAMYGRNKDHLEELYGQIEEVSAIKFG